MSDLAKKAADYAAAVQDADARVSAIAAEVSDHELASSAAFADGDPLTAAQRMDSAHEARDRLKAAVAYRDMAWSQHQAAVVELRRQEQEESLERMLADQAALKQRSVDAVAMAVAAVSDARTYALEAKQIEQSIHTLNMSIEGARADLEGRGVSGHPSMACGPLPLAQLSSVAIESGTHRPETIVAALAAGAM